MNDTLAINLSKTIGTFPFVRLGNVSPDWQGLEAFTYRLTVPEEFRTTPPTIFWEHTTLVMHVAGQPNRLEVHDGQRWTKHLSKPGGIHFSPMNTQKLMRWTEPATNIAISVHRNLLTIIAQETMRGDPSRQAIGALSYFEDAFLTQCGYVFAGLLPHEDPADRLYAEALGVTICHHLMRYYAGKPRFQSPPRHVGSAALERAMDYLHAHWSEDVSLMVLAESAGMSMAHFSRLFRQKLGVSPHQYLIRLRCEKACEMLRRGRLTVAEIAQNVGFFDQSHLTRHFKRQYRMTPSEWLASQL
jgi:AraC family transcriptional regulator